MSLRNKEKKMKRDIKRDIKTGIWLLCGLMAVAATGCVREETESDTRGTALLTVVGRAFGTRAAASEADGSTSFTDGDALSLFMRGTTYADVDNRRVNYTATGGTGTWKIEGKEILLNDRTAVASLVFPYSEAAAYDHIALAPGPYDVDKNDVVWKQQQVYASVHEAKVTDMKHALTRIKIILKRDDPADVAIPDRYTGAGSVTSVSLDNGSAAGTGVNAAVFTAGKLDLSSAQPASPVTGVTAGAVEDKTTFTLSTTGRTTDLLTLPVAAMAKNLVMLNIVVDGTTMTQSFPYSAPADKWEAGTCYVYTVTVKNAEVTFDKVVTTDWVTGEAIDGELNVRPVVGAYKDGGIVFWVDPINNEHYKVVSLDERNLTWSEADAWTTAYGAGWYLPTENELTELYKARNSSGGIGTSYIDRGIIGYGGIAFGNGEYWSATDTDVSNAQSVNLSDGTSASAAKTTTLAARAVKELSQIK